MIKRKTALLYIRVSTDEQAEKGYSLPAQQTTLEKYCKSNNIEVMKIFQDDYSAWESFERPGYNQLHQYLAINRNKIDYLFFTQWSRFSRNITSSFNEIKKLQALSVEPNAVEQLVDFTIPENQYMLAMYLVAPQVENDRLSIRTKVGMRQAVKEGRWLWQAPKGYKNNTLTKLIEVDENCAPVVKWCFEEYSKGLYSAEEIRHHAFQKGLVLTKQGFLNMLANPFYKGKINLSAYKDEPQQLIHGVHESIITDEMFNAVQQVLQGKRKPYKCTKAANENAFHLRGLLICPACGKPLTGGFSKGNGGLYSYYHCQASKYKCKVSFRAEKAHHHMAEYLKQYEPNAEVTEVFKNVLADIYNTKNDNCENQKKAIENTIKKVEESILKVEDDYLSGSFCASEYTQLNKRLQDKKNDLVMQHATVNKLPADFNNYISYSCGLIQNLSSYYANAQPSVQNKLIGLIFPEKITFTGSQYKTTKTNEVFNLICVVGKGLQKNSPAKIARLYTVAPPVGLEPTTL